jgi:hypothetical protein
MSSLEGVERCGKNTFDNCLVQVSKLIVLPFSPLAHRTQVRGKNIFVSVVPGQSVAVEKLPEGALPIGSFAVSPPKMRNTLFLLHTRRNRPGSREAPFSDKD